MPYTYPSHRSPPSSAPTSPTASRRPSFQNSSPTATRPPALPRSSSYLTRHRRTPSAVSNGLGSNEPSSEDLNGMASASTSSVRQSPPPVTDGKSMPKGVVVSPPESSSSSDDELPEVRGRQLDNIKELHAAISQIPQNREGSPTKASLADAARTLLLPSPPTSAENIHHSFSTGSMGELARSGRRISHVRSSTEPHVLVTKSADNSLTASEEESEDEMPRKPQMVRKKSGELVRPALRPASRRRPSSMPGTPTFSKAVHFDSHLEHVRHFLQVDRPLAVSAGSSPVDNYDSDSEYPFPVDERPDARSPPSELEIVVSNFPVETPVRKAQAVRLERVWLSNDHKCLMGSVAVTNLAFHKAVTCRFTLDYWKTTSEVAAEYMSEILPGEGGQGHDRFNFTIKLSDMANLETKTLYFCIRYNVSGQEFWDNNNGANFQVDFRKKMLPQNGKKGVIGAASRPANSALPRSTRRSNAAGAPLRPKLTTNALDEFGDSSRLGFDRDRSIHEYMGESGATGLRLKSVKSTSSIPSDNLSKTVSAPSGQAFANRYDFNASLTAALQATKDSMSLKAPEVLYMKAPPRKSPQPSTSTSTSTTPTPTASASEKAVSKGPATQRAPSAVANNALPAIPGAGPPSSASISSSSYEELVNKYCFFGSKQSSPQIKDGTLRGGRFDGGDDMLMTGSTNSSTSSGHGSPVVQMSHRQAPGQSALHHSLHPKDPNPYFQHATQFMTYGGSPVGSPPHSTVHRAEGSSAAAQPRSVASGSSQSPARTASPASTAGSFQPFAGTSPHDFAYERNGRFPFSGSETHAAAAIRG